MLYTMQTTFYRYIFSAKVNKKRILPPIKRTYISPVVKSRRNSHLPFYKSSRLKFPYSTLNPTQTVIVALTLRRVIAFIHSEIV